MTTEISSEKALSEQFLIFLLDEKNYGFPILDIDGIINIPKITPMPKTSHFVKGIINVRGQIIPVIDLRLFLGMPEVAYNEHTCIILINVILDNSKKLMGFVVDTVSEVFDIPVSDIEEHSKCGVKIEGDFLKGIGKAKDKIIILLDMEKIVTANQTEVFKTQDMYEDLCETLAK